MAYPLNKGNKRPTIDKNIYDITEKIKYSDNFCFAADQLLGKVDETCSSGSILVIVYEQCV